MENELVDSLDTKFGKLVLELLLDMKAKQLSDLLGDDSLKDFIDRRCEMYEESLTLYLTASDFNDSLGGHSGAAEKARAEALEGFY